MLSAIPHPNPILEKTRVALTYDKDKEGVDYTLGTYHQISNTHTVLATDDEYNRWTKKSWYKKREFNLDSGSLYNN